MQQTPSRFLRPALSVVLLASLLACAPAEQSGESPAPAESTGQTAATIPDPQFCAQAPHDVLCSFLPHDMVEPLQIDYNGLDPFDQRNFDNFSWQSFVALNWPAHGDGTPATGPIGSDPAASRVWMFYQDPLTVFDAKLPDGRTGAPLCNIQDAENLPQFQLMAKADLGGPIPESFQEATGQPLIDRDLNFVVYDVRLNPVEVGYIQEPEPGFTLVTVDGQKAFKNAGKTVSFPLGYYENDTTRTGGSVGALEIKSAWRILDESSTPSMDRFYTTRGLVSVPAENRESGEAYCFEATLGLVAMHVVQRTTNPSSQPQDWLWSTFEHADSAPVATNAADPTQDSKGPADCLPPTDAGDDWSFFNPACTSCGNNAVPPEPAGGTYKWATSPPYAAAYAVDGQYGTQVVRCRSIFDETAQLNAAFQEKLAGTVWANYQLVNTQWTSKAPDPEVPKKSVPFHLVNVAQETYIQTPDLTAANDLAGNPSSCLDCHAFARTTAGQDANFSFMLGLAKYSRKN